MRFGGLVWGGETGECWGAPKSKAALMTAAKSANPLTGILLSLAAFAVFSTHDAVIKFLGGDYMVIQILFFSTLFGFPPMALEMSAERALDNFRPHNAWAIIGRVTFTLISMSTVFYAFTVLPLTQVYAILFTTPMIITILSVPLLGEEVGLRRWLAILIGFVGVLIVVRPGVTPLTLGHAAAMVGALSNSFGAILLRRIGNTERSVVLILYPTACILVVMALLLPGVYKPMPLPDLGLMAAVGLLAFTGQMLNVSAYKLTKAAIIAPMQYSQIIWATLFGMLIFDDVPDRWTLIGASVIILSGLFIVWREAGARASQTKPVLKVANLRHDTGMSPDPKGKKRGLD